MTISIARRLGAALGVKSETSIRAINAALLEYVRLTQQSATTPAAGSIDASQVVSGTFANARIAESNVTQHQAALAVAAEKILGVGLSDFANDGAAASGGIDVGGLYRNGSVVQVRVS